MSEKGLNFSVEAFSDDSETGNNNPGVQRPVQRLVKRYGFLVMLAMLGVIAGCGGKDGKKDEKFPGRSIRITASLSVPSPPETDNIDKPEFFDQEKACDPKTFDIHEAIGNRDSRKYLGACGNAETFQYLARFAELVRGFYDPIHPESVFAKLKLAFTNESISALISVAKFLEVPIEEAATKAGLDEFERLLYHIISFENSGGLDKGSHSGCVGPSQIQSNWLKSPVCADVENFKSFEDKNGHATFDGRYDPIANVEAGARIFKYYINLIGENHPDFAMLAYNQGEGSAMSFVEWWARSNSDKKTSKAYRDWCGKAPLPLDRPLVIKRKNGTVIRATWCPEIPRKGKNKGKMQFPNTARFRQLLDMLNVPLAQMLKDEKVYKGLMDSMNGGRGYLSKILGVWEVMLHKLGVKSIASDEVWRQAGGRKGVNRTAPQTTDVGNWPIVFDGKSAEVKHQWVDLYKPVKLPKGVSLRKFAVQHGLDFEALAFINQQIRNDDAAFPEDVRIWVLTDKGQKEWNSLFAEMVIPADTNLDDFAKKNGYKLSVLLHINTKVIGKINPFKSFGKPTRIVVPKSGSDESAYAYFVQQGISLIDKARKAMETPKKSKDKKFGKKSFNKPPKKSSGKSRHR